MPDVRTTPCIDNPQIINARLPFSNFSYIENSFGKRLRPVQRIFSQARVLGYNTLVVEKIENVGFSEEDDAELKKVGFDISSIQLIRLSFFSASFQSAEDIKKLDDNCFLGYAILKQIPQSPSESEYRWIVFESVMKPSRYENIYLHGMKKYSINVNNMFFNITGHLYCQQNNLTNVCVHAALRTCLSSIFPSGDFSYKRMNDILVAHKKPHRIGDALSIQQISTILNELGIKYSLQVYKKDDKENKEKLIPYQSFLYASIESGFPALLGFSLRGTAAKHIIPIIGHTFNQDTWVPDAEASYFRIGNDTRYIKSESWLSTYVCHDDNFGSYYCLPKRYLANEVEVVIALRSPQAEYDAIEAEAIGAEYLYSLVQKIAEEATSIDWMKRIIEDVKKGWFVLRTLCVSSEDYIKHLSSLKGWDNKTIPVKLITVLGEAFMCGVDNLWIVEISSPELFPANRRKLGEIVLDPTKPITTNQDLSNLVFIRLLNKVYSMYCDEKGDISLSSYDAGIDTHTDLYTK